MFSSSEFDENIGFFARENIPHTSLFSVRFDPLNGVLILNRGRWDVTFRLELCAVCCHSYPRKAGDTIARVLTTCSIFKCN